MVYLKNTDSNYHNIYIPLSFQETGGEYPKLYINAMFSDVKLTGITFKIRGDIKIYKQIIFQIISDF